MTDKEIALEIISRHEKKIRERLLTDGFMFDDEFNEIVSPVAREIPACIKNYFHLRSEEDVIRDEINTEERSNGVFYFSECNMDFQEVKEIANYPSFCSQSYFGNIFRQQTGMTPARYRKKYGKWKEQNK